MSCQGEPGNWGEGGGKENKTDVPVVIQPKLEREEAEIQVDDHTTVEGSDVETEVENSVD